MKKINFALFLTIAAIFFAGLYHSPAFALSLADAKSQGLVGEKNSGYLGAVKSSPEVDALVSDINAKRTDFYKKAAASTKVDVKIVETRAGERAIQETPAGQFVDSGSGWKKK